jgi:enamine deaminase RidA (YjgF/YER057c/UK114 family)
MAVKLVRSTRLFPGAPYAYAAKASRGVLLFTAGACPLDEQGQVVALGDVSAQMRQALQNLRIALEESGATIPDVLKTTVYLGHLRPALVGQDRQGVAAVGRIGGSAHPAALLQSPGSASGTDQRLAELRAVE